MHCLPINSKTLYLRLSKFRPVGFEVVLDAERGPGERDAADQHDGQQDVREDGREVHHLEEIYIYILYSNACT